MQTAAAAADTNQVDPYDAWWTGSLLSAYGRTLRPGHVVVEPYLIYSAPLKENPTHTLVPLIAAGAGITDAFDIQFILQGVFQAQGGASSTQIGDTSVRLGFQMLEDRHDGSWFPDLMFTVRETIPTGRYDQLDPNLRGTDASGSGAFTTSFGANVQKIFLPSNLHPLRMRLNLLFQFPSRASLQTGNVYPGKTVSALVSGEYHLTQQWVAALDLAYAHTTLLLPRPLTATRRRRWRARIGTGSPSLLPSSTISPRSRRHRGGLSRCGPERHHDDKPAGRHQHLSLKSSRAAPSPAQAL